FTRGRHKFRPDSVMHATSGAIDWGGRHPSQDDGHGLRQKRKYTPDIQGQSGQETIPPDVDFAYPSNVISPGKNREALGHGAAFPVALPSFFIKAYSDEGDAILDPFMGSGSTLIAAEQLDRKCYGIEISPAYCDIIIRRWEEFTGKKATLAGKGE
ncbi:unnamed protein product, partial [marine sediment metagenome]